MYELQYQIIVWWAQKYKVPANRNSSDTQWLMKLLKEQNTWCIGSMSIIFDDFVVCDKV